MKNHKAIFLDRDGVINYDYGYVGTIKRFVFLPKIFEHLKKFKDLGYLLIIVTNQGGVSLKKFSQEDFFKLNEHMLNMLSQNGVEILDVFYSFYHPKNPSEFLEHEDLRKPKPDMILKAAEKHNIDLENSYLIGDKDTDIEAGEKAGLKYNFLLHTNKKNKIGKDQAKHELFKSMSSIVKYIRNDNN